MKLKNAKRLQQEQAQLFPITANDWRDARHHEDPADRLNRGDINRSLDASDHGSIADLDVLSGYEF